VQRALLVGDRLCQFEREREIQFVVEISRCRAPLHRSTSDSHRPAPDVELYSSTALQRALYISTALSTALYTYILYTLSLSVRAAAAYTARGFLTDYYVLERV